MSNVVALMPRPGNDAQRNLSELVTFYKKHTPFQHKQDWCWDNLYWNVKGICKSEVRKATNNSFLYFNRDNQKGSNKKDSRDDMLPFHHQELSDVAKCHVTALQIEKAKNVGSLQLWINAYRYLDNVLGHSKKCISELSAHDFKLAELEAQKHLKDSTFYRIGAKLEGICKFINQKKLTDHKITYRKSSKRGETHTNSDSRIDHESVTKRSEKLPPKEALMALAALSNKPLKGDDRLFQAMVEIMFATGLRFDELVSLDKNCVYEKEIEETNVLTGKQEVFTVYEIRYKSKKSGGYRTKTVAKSLVPILKKGVNTAEKILKPVRDTITELSRNQMDFFPQLEDAVEATIPDSWRLLNWSSNSNFQTYLKKRAVTITKRAQNVLGKHKTVSTFQTSELKEKTVELARESLSVLWESVRNQTVAERPQDLLFITQHQRHHSVKSTEPWRFTMVSHTQITDYISGRPSLGVKSVFERNNLTFEGVPIRITSHQFRHFLSTMLELSDTVSDIEVARYFGRKYMGDNATYNHTNKTKKVMDEADTIIASTALSREQEKEAAILFTLVDREEALDTIQDLTTTLTTSIGLCKHDYNDSPCGKHYACLRGCAEYYRVKGNPSEIDEVKRIRDQQKLHVEAAREAVEEEYHNANNWLLSHEELLNGCQMALAIENDDSIAVGERVQIFPDGKTKCEAV
ncbi:hypothetical protein MTsDn5_15170 [Alteromonas gracilis]|uniref:hypothetical protein n=1 Tax=Alteromonas gracilis TaxID=1479524 RepID=UPI0036F41D42